MIEPFDTTTRSNDGEAGFQRLANAAEAAATLSHSTYSGTVEGADIERLTNASEAAAALSQSTYSGTVEGADFKSEL